MSIPPRDTDKTPAPRRHDNVWFEAFLLLTGPLVALGVIVACVVRAL